jgi:DNA-3-methyladenine glycosylase I
MSTTITGPDGRPRCGWCDAAPEFLDYHDTEWGLPVSDDYRLVEKLCLEGFQAGLSWRTILAKRENFPAAFHDFDCDRIARFTQRDINRLLKDEGIVRHRGKIEAVINNAQRARDLIKQEGSLAAFIWRYEADVSQRAKPQSASTSAESIAVDPENCVEIACCGVAKDGVHPATYRVCFR